MKSIVVTVIVLLLVAVSEIPRMAADAGAPDRAARLQSMRGEIRRLELELHELRRREQGVLGELERLGAELRLRGAELEEVSLHLEDIGERIETTNGIIVGLERDQHQRRAYLASRLRQIYKEGPSRSVKRFLGGESMKNYWSGVRYAAYLSRKDGRVLGAYRGDAERLSGERRELISRQAENRALGEDLSGARERLSGANRRRTRVLEDIREDAVRREVALEELQAAADSLASLVEALPSGEVNAELDVRKFRGLLDWPAEGPVTDGFGSVVHPRFKTRVPHPGLDIDGDFQTRIRSVFDGRVVFADWMRGYGLTAIVDHGGGVLSVYAHASVLLVEQGEVVTRGQALGRIGETGSLKGPYLYFELRVGGKPVDPVDWLRPRVAKGPGQR